MSVSVHISHRFGGSGAGATLDIDFTAPAGLTVLFGRSGAGKTSVVRAVAGLFRPDAGRIEVAGRTLFDSATRTDLPLHRRRIGYIFQDARLFPHLSVGRNLDYGRRRAPKGAVLPERDHVIDMLGLGPLLTRRPRDLSGGETQRVAIGRALLAGPDLLLADEPLAALDGARKAEILPYFERLRDEGQVPILYVTHSVAEVARLATTVVALKAGRVEAVGPALDLLGDPGFTPTGPRDAGAVIEARVLAHHPDGLTELATGPARLFLPQIDLAPGAGLRLRIAAQDVMLSRTAPVGLSALNILPGQIAAIREGEGPGAMVSLDTAAGRILARITRRSATAMGLAPGQPCHAVIKTVSIAPDGIAPAAPS